MKLLNIVNGSDSKFTFFCNCKAATKKTILINLTLQRAKTGRIQVANLVRFSYGRRKVPVWKSCRVERAHMTDFSQIYIAIKHFLVAAINDCWPIRCSEYMCSTLG